MKGAKFQNVIVHHLTIIYRIGHALLYLTAIMYHQNVCDTNPFQTKVILNENSIIATRCFSMIRIQLLAPNLSTKRMRWQFWKRLVQRIFFFLLEIWKCVIDNEVNIRFKVQFNLWRKWMEIGNYWNGKKCCRNGNAPVFWNIIG